MCKPLDSEERFTRVERHGASVSDRTPKLWLVRLGRRGEFEGLALSAGLLSIDFGVRADFTRLTTRDAVGAVVASALPNEPPARQSNVTGQIHRFANEMAACDVVVSPLRTRPVFAIGEISGPYQRLPDGRAARPVRWLLLDATRLQFAQDLLYSLGALMTVCEVRRPNGIQRVRAIAVTGMDPGR